jgi:2-amino-4-hydroxy-6-hydroxymethyldihydropteridine diphosphokinase
VSEDAAALRVSAYVGLGSNLGDAAGAVRSALAALAALADTEFVRASPLYRTPPWGGIVQQDFVNAAAQLHTALAPRDLLERLLAIERAHGRHRDGSRWGPRTLDLDLLVYARLRIREPDLVLPHPHIAERAFVLAPLADIASDLEIPGAGRVRDLLAHVDASACVRLD